MEGRVGLSRGVVREKRGRLMNLFGGFYDYCVILG